ncbi:exodeoxyribonuclease VII small subunit [Streptomyces diastatochromogenes]|nr:exodeoxyribonuclease VII small subunit [Streptomyces diastatochromogenes]
MAAGTDTGAEETALGYEQARDELIEVVRRLEAGGTSLEESLALWERGEELAKVCRRRLEGPRPTRRLAGGGARGRGGDGRGGRGRVGPRAEDGARGRVG